MTNVFEDFLRGNIKEVILGLAVGLIITLLGNFTLQEGITLIIISPLIALVLNQILKGFVPNTKNQRTALIVLSLIAGFLIMQQFNIGAFSVENIQSSVQPQSSATTLAGLTGKLAGKAGLYGLLSGVGAIAFFLHPIIGLVFVGALMILVGVPLIGLSIAIFQNFQLVVIIAGLISLSFILFKDRNIRSRKR